MLPKILREPLFADVLCDIKQSPVPMSILQTERRRMPLAIETDFSVLTVRGVGTTQTNSVRSTAVVVLAALERDTAAMVKKWGMFTT